jgi:hypothetical protein
MSNGTQFVYTPDQTAAHFDQFSKAMELTRERQRRPGLVTQALQVIIGNEDIITAPKMITTPTGKIFHVMSDPKVRSAADAINALDCPIKWGLAETPDKIPMIIQPVDSHIRAVPLGKFMTIDQVYNAYPKAVTPAGWVAFGIKFPEEQCEAPHFSVWLDTLGRFVFGILRVSGDRRCVDVRRYNPGDEFYDNYRVLVRE